MKITVKPSAAKGRVTAPPSKSMAHRLITCASMAKGKSIIRNVAYSQDILATIDCMSALGAEIVRDNDTLYINGADIGKQSVTRPLDCRECGSTLRFMIPICWLSQNSITLKGSERLMARPLGVYADIAKDKSLGFEYINNSIITKGKLTGGKYRFPGNISSQFVSGLLFALPMCEEDSIIELIPPIESRSYIEMTLFALQEFGINVECPNDNSFFIKGGQSYKPCEMSVEGDYSNAAFLKALDVIGGNVEVRGLASDSRQGDKICSEHFENMKKGFCDIDLGDCPDLGPILFAAAAAMKGAHFTSTARLRIKESDRVAAMVQELEKMNVKCKIEDNEVTVYSSELKYPSEILSGHNDHRIVMALTVLMTITGGELEGAQAVRKSYPDFFDVIKALGIEVETDGMDM